MSYRQSHYADAAHYFEAHYKTSPQSDTALYYLYNCYRQLSDQDRAIGVLTRLVDMGKATTDIVQILFDYYQSHARYKDLYILLTAINGLDRRGIYEHVPLTRRLYAEILLGASTVSSSASDPLVFAITKNLIPACPDGDFYPDDSLTYGNLIILLDRLVKPHYPSTFRSMNHVPNTSYLYLPYMRLIELGLLDYDPELRPGDYASVMFAVTCVQRLKRKGILD
ncbi:MAG: tetratricopeptide repeat protein [candidate division WOR-3 bacterium]|nr:MAG: tetratricopeptide repeat protein [candidate division WOR-3 bacterium]